MVSKRLLPTILSLLLAFTLVPLGLPAGAQEKKEGDEKEKQKKSQDLSEQLPRRELTEKQRKRREEALRKELERHFKKWLEEDVVYIITPEEKEVFKELGTDEEREQFIEQFWLRRDVTPDTVENETKEEHYRRIAYANERFASGKPGWRTDRGRIYIMWGPPDEIESHPSGGTYYRPMEEGGGSTSTYPFEKWRYRYIEGLQGANAQEVILEFVDPTFSGEYRMTMDPSEKDALLNVPGMGLSLLEEMGLASKADRFDRTDGTRLPLGVGELGGTRRASGVNFNQFDRLQQFAAIFRPPEVKFKDLEALVTTRISFNLLPFEVRTDFLRVTDSSVLVPLTIALKKKDMTFQMKEGLHQSIVNVFGRVSTLTGRVVQTFEDVLKLDVPPALLEQTLEEPSVYQKALALRPGLYKLNIVLKDLNSGNIGTLERRLAVPEFPEEDLTHSTLILADSMQRVALKNVGSGQFVIGNTKVRPAVPGEFHPGQRMGIYLQVYNLGVNEKTFKPDAVIAYSIRRGDEAVFSFEEKTGDMERAGRQITLEKLLTLANMGPGDYTLSIEINDKINNTTIKPTAGFRIVK
ncbi:MAG: GWxTD domain-containing protein [Terriglobia bacterium]